MKMIKKEFPVIVEQTEGGFESRLFRREKLEKKWDKLQKEKPIYHEWHCTKCNNGTFYKTERKTHSSLLRGWDVSDKCS